MARGKIILPTKPYPDFPLFPAKNGQWRKDIWNPRLKRAEQFYFGPWEDDPKGERALAEYVTAKDAIANGTYHAKIASHQGGYTVRQLAKDYLAARYQDMHTGKLTGSAYKASAMDILVGVGLGERSGGHGPIVRQVMVVGLKDMLKVNVVRKDMITADNALSMAVSNNRVSKRNTYLTERLNAPEQVHPVQS